MKKFLFIITTLFLILSATFCVDAQKRKRKLKVSKITNRREKIILVIGKPPVYLSFERIGDGEPLKYDEGRERVWLKLNNNTKWSIYVGEFEIGDDGERGVFYEIESEAENVLGEEIPIGHRRGHNGSPNVELKAGESILFDVPKEHLAKSLMIRIDFGYKWEYFAKLDDYPYPFSRNSVYFSDSDLEYALKNKLKSK